MPELIDPGTRSPGFIKIFMTYPYRDAHVAWRFVGESFPSLSAITTEMTALTDALRDVLPSSVYLTGYSILNNDHIDLYHVDFGIALNGTKPSYLGEEAWHSRYLCVTGRGAASDLGFERGHARTFLYVEAGIDVAPGEKSYNRDEDADVDAFCDYLETNALWWADFYGQKAAVRPSLRVGYNDFIKRHFGL